MTKPKPRMTRKDLETLKRALYFAIRDCEATIGTVPNEAVRDADARREVEEYQALQQKIGQMLAGRKR